MQQLCIMFICLSFAACGSSPPLTPIKTDSDNIQPDEDGCRWQLGECGDEDLPNSDDDIVPTDQDSGDDDQPPVDLDELVLGSWMGEISFDNGTRMLGIIFKDTGHVDFVINPFGPARVEYDGTYYSVNNENIIITLTGVASLTWQEVVVQNSSLHYVTADEEEITLQRGISFPDYGFTAELFVYDDVDAPFIELLKKDSIFSLSKYFDYSGLLEFVHNQSPTPICHDRVYGVTNLHFTGDENFTSDQIPGFNQWGGSHCQALDHFAVIYYGSFQLPVGRTGLRFHSPEASSKIDDAGISFWDDDVLAALDSDGQSFCSSTQGSTNPRCFKVNSEYIGQSEVSIEDSIGGLMPLEFIYLDISGSANFTVEYDPGYTGNWQHIPADMLLPPDFTN